MLLNLQKSLSLGERERKIAAGARLVQERADERIRNEREQRRGKLRKRGAEQNVEAQRMPDAVIVAAAEKLRAENALAAAAAAWMMGIPGQAVSHGLESFHGAGRRMEFKGKYNGADVYDDYAHHPGELKVLLDTVEKLDYKRSILVFQPHTYSRTAALFDDFVQQLKRPDVLLLAEIFAAREKNTIGISSALLAEQIDGAVFYDTFKELERTLKAIARPGDIILTVGAGDVYKIGEDILK